MNKYVKIVIRYVVIMAGLFIIANGFVLIVQSRLGADPWNVFHLGISSRTGASLGLVMQAVGAVTLIAGCLLGVKPHVGTVLNAIFIGLFVDYVRMLGYIPLPDPLWLKIIFCAGGIFLTGLGSACYLSGKRGAGPRDSLMLALIRITKLRLGLIRGAMEVTVTIIGIIMGGPAGIGTIIYAVSVGFCIETGFALIRFVQRSDLYIRYWRGLIQKENLPLPAESERR